MCANKGKTARAVGHLRVKIFLFGRTCFFQAWLLAQALAVGLFGKNYIITCPLCLTLAALSIDFLLLRCTHTNMSTVKHMLQPWYHCQQWPRAHRRLVRAHTHSPLFQELSVSQPITMPPHYIITNHETTRRVILCHSIDMQCVEKQPNITEISSK